MLQRQAVLLLQAFESVIELAVQLRHVPMSSAPVAVEYLPVWHSMHEGNPGRFEYFPAGQAEQLFPPEQRQTEDQLCELNPAEQAFSPGPK